MAEAAPKVESAPREKEAGPVTPDTGFEPEILAFCCEH
jgi:hypothetical protein